MKHRLRALCTAIGLLALLETAAAAVPPCAPENGGINLPEGFCAQVVADGVGRARHLTVRQNGDIYVRLLRWKPGGSLVALRDSTGDGRADIIRRFCSLGGGTGIGIRGDGLYFSTTTTVYRYGLADGKLLPEEAPVPMIEGLPVQLQHAARSFAFDGENSIYLNLGAPSNACQQRERSPGSPGVDPCPQRETQAGIWRFDASRTDQDLLADGMRYAGGIRNAVALAWNPRTGGLFAVQHGRDQLHALWPRLYSESQNAELPAEEFLRVGEGSDFGWPYCYYDQILGKKVLAPEYGGDGRREGRCRQFDTPTLAFPGHWAPNSLLFYTGDQFSPRYRGGAFIAFHGSWNRTPLEQQGYKVVFVPFEGREPSGIWQDFADGFAGTGPIRRSGDARYRPMGLAEGPDGALYISDSVKGRIWRVFYRGEGPP